MATPFFLLTLILPIFFFFFFFNFIHATVFEIQNSCLYTVWAAAVPGGGKRLEEGQTWNITVSSNTSQGRIWGRTNCNFEDSGNGTCESGDCGGLLQCQGYGTPPNTMAEYSLKQPNDLDFFDISLVDGFNIPMEFGPTSEGCSRGANCTGDVNGLCPNELRDPGGCNNPCTVFNNDQYCCISGSCNATIYSMFFKENCPDAFSYPTDDGTTFSCPAGTNYRVVFCPP